MTRSHMAIKNEGATIKVALIDVGNKFAASRVWESKRERHLHSRFFWLDYKILSLIHNKGLEREKKNKYKLFHMFSRDSNTFVSQIVQSLTNNR